MATALRSSVTENKILLSAETTPCCDYEMFRLHGFESYKFVKNMCISLHSVDDSHKNESRNVKISPGGPQDTVLSGGVSFELIGQLRRKSVRIWQNEIASPERQKAKREISLCG